MTRFIGALIFAFLTFAAGNAEAKHRHRIIAEKCQSSLFAPCLGTFKAERAKIVPHPIGCPARAFCGCGAAVRIFGRPIRDLWLAANWFKFPRATPASGMVAVRRHHVFVLEQHISGSTWLAYDANSGQGPLASIPDPLLDTSLLIRGPGSG